MANNLATQKKVMRNIIIIDINIIINASSIPIIMIINICKNIIIVINTSVAGKRAHVA